MTDSNAPQPGAPCWIDITTLDADKTKAFYSELLGWEFDEPREEFGGYTRIRVNGKVVAGLNPMAEGFTTSVWSMYIATDDINKTSELITSNGGTLIAPAMEVGDLGYMLIATDPSNAVFGAWQSGTFSGAEVFNQPGALFWEDLRSKDPEAARAFYKAVFNYDYADVEMANANYKTFAHAGGDRPLGGIGDMMGAPDDVPSHWLVYLCVEDTPAALSKVPSLGGTVIVETTQMPWGRMGGVVDNTGATFLIMDQTS